MVVLCCLSCHGDKVDANQTVHCQWKMFHKSLFKQIFFFSFSFSLLKGRDSDGFPVFQEKFIRECIRKFPYCDATLLQQLVRSIAPVEIVSNSDDSAPKNNCGLNCRFVVLTVILIQGFSTSRCRFFPAAGIMELCSIHAYEMTFWKINSL